MKFNFWCALCEENLTCLRDCFLTFLVIVIEGMKGVMQKVQRFGGAMFTPVLLFSFAGIMVGLSTLFMNQSIFGALAAEEGIWYKIWYMIQEGAWMVFRQMPLLFAIGLPIGLAKKQNARCVLEAFTIYVTFNYFLSAILKFWGTNFGVDFAAEVGGTSGLANVCGIKTLDTGMLGALIISGVVVWIHNKYFDTELPEWLGIFSGSSFVVMIGFFVMIPMAFLFALGWPKIQEAMLFLQDFFKSSGTIGVGLYAFSEKILLPTGLHHFIYAPFALDSAVVPGGIEAYWNLHLSEFAQSTKPLRELFPAGAFHLYGTPKVFAPMGITLAFYTTAKKEKRKQVLALMIPAALTAMLTGITEPIEFTFLFIAPVLFLVHAILCACLNMAMYIAGVRGAFANGLIAWGAQDWIPCWQNHWMTYVIQILVGLAFTLIWFLVFRFLIKKFNFKTPGREDEAEETKLYTKKDYKEKQAEKNTLSYAAQILDYLGGKENIVDGFSGFFHNSSDTLHRGVPTSTRSPCFTFTSNPLPSSFTVSNPIWIKSSAPSSVSIAMACFVGAIRQIVPAAGAEILPSLGMIAIPSPSFLPANVSSGTSSRAIVFPFCIA